MQITITPTQASKASTALRSLYLNKNDPDIEALDSRPQEGLCICGVTLLADESGQIPEYCSEQCRQRAYRERNKSRRYKAREVVRTNIKRTL